jgi:hypothetical protein
MAAARFAGLYSESLSYLGFRAVALHPRLDSAARIRGLKKRAFKTRSKLDFGHLGRINNSVS